MKKFIIYSICALFGFSFLAFGQAPLPHLVKGEFDSKMVIEGLRKFYSSHNLIYHELTYRLYPDHVSTIPYSTETGVFIFQAESQYSQLGPIESLTTKTYTIGIDNEEKVMIISNLLSIPATNPMDKVEALLANSKAFNVNSESEQVSSIEISLESGEIEQATLSYNPHSFQPIKFVLLYRNSIQLSANEDAPFVQPRLEIEYSNTSFNDEGKDKINPRTYLIPSGSKWLLAPLYRSYELIENIHEIPDAN